MPLLFQAEGPGWKLEIIGKLPELPPFLNIAPISSIVFDGATSIETIDPKTGLMRAIVSGQSIEPIFFEAVAYDIHFEKTSPESSIALPPGAETRRVRKENEHHTLNFGNNVGFADVSVSSHGGNAKFRLEVFSRKADYRTDYVLMRDEISGILRNLAMAANAKTYGMAAPARDRYPTLGEWFALLKTHFEDFIKLANSIAKNPQSGLAVKEMPKDTERARHVSRQTIGRSLRRPNGGPAILGLDIVLPRRIHESVSSITFDTPANRYYKALIKATYRNMRALAKVGESGDEDADRNSERKFFESIRPELKAMMRGIEAVLRTPFLGQVTDAPLERPESMVFHKHPLYSRFDKLCRLLNGGLSFVGEIVPIGLKETSLLYEYWCFLKLVALLRERFDLVDQSVVKVNRMRTTVTLSKGKPSAMKFTHKLTGKPLYLVYNRLFNRLPTIAQKPDNVIQFASETKFYIFDAKYRIQFDSDYSNLYGGPGPMTEDVNTMHRYRDAIVIPHPMRPQEYVKGVVSGAVVLFPYPDEEKYRAHKFFNSIKKVEIGGLPFLPNATKLVAEKISSLLASEYPEPRLEV